jgi:hypothetical protein
MYQYSMHSSHQFCCFSFAPLIFQHMLLEFCRRSLLSTRPSPGFCIRVHRRHPSLTSPPRAQGHHHVAFSSTRSGVSHEELHLRVLACPVKLRTLMGLLSGHHFGQPHPRGPVCISSRPHLQRVPEDLVKLENLRKLSQECRPHHPGWVSSVASAWASSLQKPWKAGPGPGIV